MKLSLIIPVYKVEPFIYKCLDSIYKQYRSQYSLEVILVNDGTPDNSMLVIQPLLEKMPYVHVINQKNQGLSVSRNNGLEASVGDYVWFIDSDDWLLPNALTDVFAALDAHRDVAVFSTILEVNEEDEDRPHNEYNPERGLLSGKQYLTRRYRQGASQRFIFKRTFLKENRLSFCPGILHEDGLFGYKMLYIAPQVFILDNPVYAYRIRKQGSIMSSISMKTPEDLIFIHKELTKFSESYVKPGDKDWYRTIIFNILCDLFSFSKYLLKTEEFSDFYKKNKSYIDKEALFVIRSRRCLLSGLRIFFIPIFYWRARLFFKKVLKKQ